MRRVPSELGRKAIAVGRSAADNSSFIFGGETRCPVGPTMDAYAVNEEACRGRQRRLLAEMERLGVELAVLTSRESVQWLTGALIRPPFETLAAQTAGGKVSLVVPERQIQIAAAVDERVGYPAKLHSTNQDDQREASSEAFLPSLSQIPSLVAVEWASISPYLSRPIAGSGAELVNIGPSIFELRRRKDPDELAMMRRANEANEAMYARAREIIRPGVNELDVYCELQSVAVRTLGEPLTYFGQDFHCGARGGPPQNRAAQAGELYILDLGVGFRGYYSDNARTIAVDREPTAVQQRAWQAVADVFSLVEETVRPGTSCRELFETVQRQLDQFLPWIFNHHLGHGVGLAPQEGPHLNPNWDDTFAVGNFLAVEPGLYHEELRFGVRLEQNYVVTPKGVELLTPWPLALV